MNARERYIRELERRLPFALGHRRRVLTEVRDHLRDAGDEGLERFGSVEQLAAELTDELRARAAARASWLVPAVIVAFSFPLYVVPENTLPPAPWTVKPDYLAWKQHAAIAAFVVALGFGGVALVIGRLRPRIAFVPLVCSLAALATAFVIGSVVAVQWIDAVPGTSASITYAGIAACAFVLLALVFVVAEACRAALPQRRREFAPD